LVDDAASADPVVVTGVGLVTPLGPSAEECWRRCLDGDSAIGPLRRFDTDAFACRSAAEVDAASVAPPLRFPKNEKYMSKSVACAMQAAHEAVRSSGIDLGAVDPYRIAVHAGSGQTGIEASELFPALGLAWGDGEEMDFKDLGGRPTRLIDKYFSLRTLANAALAFLSVEFGARGAAANFVQGDTASAFAVAGGLRDLREGRCDVALVGGHESLLTVSTYLAYAAAGLLSRLPPGEAYRPFDVRRDGVVLGEGAAFLLLERRDHAEGRRATILGQVTAVAASMDTADAPGPWASAPAARRAIAEVTGGSRVDLVVAAGIGTAEADRREAALLASVFGDEVPVTAFKGATGYLGAATGAVEMALALLCLRDGRIPPIARHSRCDPDVRLDLVTGEARAARPRSALCLAVSWSGAVTATRLEAAP
jgi:3-oxoacyl-(acyl-carrier-protein) synthase